MKSFNLFLLCLLIVVAAVGQEKKKKPSAYNKQKQNQEHDKADLGDHCRGAGNDAEAEHTRQDGDDEEDNSVV